MEEKVVDRIQELMTFYGISKNAFDTSIGKGNGYIGKQIKRRASIGSDTIETILRVYREINPGWLISGEGEKIRSGFDNVARDSNAEYTNDLFEKTLLEYLDRPRVKNKIQKLLKDEGNSK